MTAPMRSAGGPYPQALVLAPGLIVTRMCAFPCKHPRRVRLVSVIDVREDE